MSAQPAPRLESGLKLCGTWAFFSCAGVLVWCCKLEALSVGRSHFSSISNNFLALHGHRPPPARALPSSHLSPLINTTGLASQMHTTQFSCFAGPPPARALPLFHPLIFHLSSTPREKGRHEPIFLQHFPAPPPPPPPPHRPCFRAVVSKMGIPCVIYINIYLYVNVYHIIIIKLFALTNSPISSECSLLIMHVSSF